MDRRTLVLLILVITPFCGSSQEAWRTSDEERLRVREMRRGSGALHFHSKRHMMPTEVEMKKRNSPIGRGRDSRKKVNQKPSGHLTPLKEDDIDNDEVVSVAIGPPPMRPMYDKIPRKFSHKYSYQNNSSQLNNNYTQGATNLVKDVLTQLGREFLSHQVNEDFVFGQYVGSSMRNLTSDLKLKMQHEVLELIIKYQKISRGEAIPIKIEDKNPLTYFKDQNKGTKPPYNDTDEVWPDFTNLAKIVGK